MTEKINELAKRAETLGCEIKFNEPMKEHISFKVGGPCKLMISLNSAESASELLRTCKENNIEYTVIGKGSNVLFEDNGYDGVVFVAGKQMQAVKLIGEDTVECESGCPLSALASFALENSLTGLEFAWGIPGTAGGAVFMNAGAYGGEMKDVVVSTEQIDENGRITSFSKQQLEFGYRTSVFHKNNLIVTKIILQLKKGDKTTIKARMDELMAKRKEKQPLEFPSAGSAFKRPDGAFAGQLIEECGLKGRAVGGAEVSQKHSGFIINKGGATCSDILKLIEIVRAEVLSKTGYNLECEVRVVKAKGDS